jgi:hypothetical protein
MSMNDVISSICDVRLACNFSDLFDQTFPTMGVKDKSYERQ